MVGTGAGTEDLIDHTLYKWHQGDTCLFGSVFLKDLYSLAQKLVIGALSGREASDSLDPAALLLFKILAVRGSMAVDSVLHPSPEAADLVGRGCSESGLLELERRRKGGREQGREREASN